jgi:hypothetical protein
MRGVSLRLGDERRLQAGICATTRPATACAALFCLEPVVSTLLDVSRMLPSDDVEIEAYATAVLPQ